MTKTLGLCGTIGSIISTGSTLSSRILDTIGLLEPEWNDFDHLTPETKLLHNTKRRTQPWKTGLPIDFTFKERGLLNFALPIVRKLAPNYTRHPDERQEAYFYALLADALDVGAVTKDQVEKEVRSGHVRPDLGAYRALSRSALAGAGGSFKSCLTRAAMSAVKSLGRLARGASIVPPKPCC